MTVYCKEGTERLAREHFIAGRITRAEFVKCLRLEYLISKRWIWRGSDLEQEKLYPGRAAQVPIDILLGLKEPE